MARILALLVLLVLASVLGGCTATLNSGASSFAFDPTPSHNGMGGWYDGTGPRGGSGGGP